MESQEIIQVISESKKAISEAKNGFWIPLSIISVCFSVVIALLLYIWNQHIKRNDSRHIGHDEMLKELKDSSVKLTVVVTKLETKLEMQDRLLMKKN
jgi:hypothetical protein